MKRLAMLAAPLALLAAAPAGACLYTSAPEPVGAASAPFFAGHMREAATFVDLAVAEETRLAFGGDPTWRPQATTFRVVQRLKGRSPDRFTLYVTRAEHDGPATTALHWVDEGGRVTPFPYPTEYGLEFPQTLTSCHPGFLAVHPGQLYLVHREADGRLLGPVRLYQDVEAQLFPSVEAEPRPYEGWFHAAYHPLARPAAQPAPEPAETVASVRFAHLLGASEASQWLVRAQVQPVAVRVAAGAFTDETRVPAAAADAKLVERALADARANAAIAMDREPAQRLLAAIDRDNFPNDFAMRAWVWTFLEAEARKPAPDAAFGIVSMEVTGALSAIARLHGLAGVDEARAGFALRGHVAAPTLVSDGPADRDTAFTAAAHETAASLLARLDAVVQGRPQPAPQFEPPPEPEPVTDCRRLVSLAIERLVVVEGRLAAAARRNAWLDAASFELLAEPCAVIAAVGDQA